MDLIKQLIKADKLELALKALLKSDIDNQYAQELLLLSARLERQKASSRKGILSNDEENLELNRIRYSIIEIITNIESVAIPQYSNTECFEIISTSRNEIRDIMSSIEAIKSEAVDRESIENREISLLLKQPKSKGNFDKIHKIFKLGSIRVREDNQKLEEDVNEFSIHVQKIKSTYSLLIDRFKELSEQEKPKLIDSINSFLDLQNSYESMRTEFQKGIKLRDDMIFDSKFSGYNRAIRKGTDIEKRFVTYLQEHIDTMIKISENEVLINDINLRNKIDEYTDKGKTFLGWIKNK